MRGKSSLPLSSYDPRFELLLLHGTRERFVLPPIEMGRAIKLRQQMQQYRAEAKRHYGEELKEKWEPLYQCIVRIETQPDGKGSVVVEPRSSMYNDVLPSLDALATAVPEGGGAPQELKGFLDELANPDVEKSS